nr:S-layer homology domain-containing protein [uncultured Oscillibacter sp.]
MKRRFLAWVLAVCAALSLMLPVAAATTRFSDVSDPTIRQSAEVLRLMGVLDGYADGTFRPGTVLNRAQFCKMAVYAMNGSSELGRYSTVTVFPDVKPSHWAASYINMAAKGKNIISGYPDGRFYPERTVTVGHAVTVLLRILGYKDENIGGVWPDSYMAVAATIGLTEGVSTNGNAGLTRGQAARLFRNLLEMEGAEGGTLYTLSEETDLVSVDGGAGTMKTSDGKIYPMVHAVGDTTLVGTHGRVVQTADGKALTFLPNSGGSSSSTSAAVIITEDGSAAGLSALAGNNNYTIYKNGAPATIADLRKNDVAVYAPGTNSIRVCDTRITVYYENCAPNPQSPTTITALGHTFNVLPTAADSLSRYKPGDAVTLLLTVDGQVAGAADPNASATRSNAVGVVWDGKVYLVCGGSTIQLDNVPGAAEHNGQAVRIAASQKEKVSLSDQKNGLSGDLLVSARRMGSRPLAENVLIFDGGRAIGINQLTMDQVPDSQILYARANWAGEVDLIVLNRTVDQLVGRVFVESKETPVYDDEGNVVGSKWDDRVGLEFGNGSDQRVGPFGVRYGVKSGDFVTAKLNSQKTGFVSMSKLTELRNVPASSWIGTSAVTFGGRTYTLDPNTVLCYNSDGRMWITLDEARAYADTFNLHVKDGVVYVVEVGG